MCVSNPTQEPCNSLLAPKFFCSIFDVCGSMNVIIIFLIYELRQDQDGNVPEGSQKKKNQRSGLVNQDLKRDQPHRNRTPYDVHAGACIALMNECNVANIKKNFAYVAVIDYISRSITCKFNLNIQILVSVERTQLYGVS